MKRLLVLLTMSGLFSVGLVGCSETATSKTETKVTTPGGETTITTEKTVKQSGDNPPPVQP